MTKAFKCGIIFLLLGTLSLAVLGQFKKLGSHKPPSKGATVVAGQFPVPGVFYYHFIQVGQPLLMKNVLNETGYTAFQKWTDDYLRTKYGDERVEIERGKKEDRNGKALELKLSKFLDIYKDSNLYMVHTVPDSMKEEVLVPPSLQCGGFQDNLQDAVLWFSSGGTKSVLHYDTVDNINCLLDGEKKLVLIDKKYKKMVEEHGWVEDGGYSEVDVDSVDPGMFPGVYNAAWYQINMQKGDCVYIPYKWYHHVYSPPGRNLAVNLWFSHLWWFNQTDCNDHSSTENKPLSHFTMASPNSQLRSEFLSNFGGSKGVSQKFFIMKSGCKSEEDAVKLWEMLNTNNDRQLTWEEFYSFDIDEAVQKVPQCFNVEIEGEEAEENQNEGNEADIQKEDIIDEEGTVENLNKEGKVENQDKTAKRDNIDEEGKVENQDKTGERGSIDEEGKVENQDKTGERGSIDEEGKVENQDKTGERGSIDEEGKVENQDKTGERGSIDEEGKVENQDKAGKGDNIDENGSKSRINNAEVKDTPFETNGNLDTESVGDNVHKVTDNGEINVDIISNSIFADDGIETKVLISEKSEETVLTAVNDDLITVKNVNTEREDSTHDKRKLEHDEF